MGIDLNTTNAFNINQISVSNSSISLLHLNNVYNSNINGRSITLSNISYYDSLFQVQDNLIIIDGIETNNDFQIYINDIVISGVTFIRGGHLVLFQQQTASKLLVSNCLLFNNNGGSINFEAYNKNNPNLTTNMRFDNMTIQNSNGYYQSLIEVTAGAEIYIYESYFINNSNYLSGGVAVISSAGAILSIFDSIFINNTSIKGGVFDIENQGFLILNNSTLQNNFAIQSGVIQTGNDGYFNIYLSILTNNFAYSSPISELFLSSTLSIINNSTIQNNEWLAKDDILQQLNNWSNLWFLSSQFKLLLLQNSDLMNIIPISNSFHLISSSLSINNFTTVVNQNNFLACFQSSFYLSDSIIKDIDLQSNLFYISSTSLTVNNVLFSNITTKNIDAYVISALLDSSIYLANIEYVNSSWSFFNSYSAQISLINMNITSISLKNYLMSFLSWDSISIVNSSITSIVSSASSALYYSRSTIDFIQNLTISNLNTVGIELLYSNITQISRLFIYDSAKGMALKYSNITIINNSEFSRCGSQKLLFGGVIDLLDCSITIENSTFNNNNAQNGGAISIRWLNFSKCENKIYNVGFESNKAEVKGGAIYYNYRRPEQNNIRFINNSAPYGSNIASYSVKIIESISKNSSIIFNEIPSGIKLDTILSLILQDYDNQTTPDSSYQIKISPLTKGAFVSGYDSARVIQGNAKFDSLAFTFYPGINHVQFKATSNAINTQNNNAMKTPSYTSIDVSFRFWGPGESQISNNSWQICSAGTYSLEWNSTSWSNWVTNGFCPGGSKIEVNPGYWRINQNSTTILKWPYPSSCLGGFIPENKHPVNWEVGYTGYLWSECDLVDGIKYQQMSGGKWAKCSNPLLNAFKFIGLVIAAFGFLMVMIILMLRKKKENQMSILIRIMTNYLQLISLALSFGLSFPDYLTQSFSIFDTIGSSSDTFLSYDWFFTSIQVTGFTPSVSLFKIVLTGLLPLILFTILAVIWITLYYALYKWFSNLKLNLIISIICIIFLLHPTITKSSLEIFEWIVVDSNDKRMKLYMEYKWYSEEHLKWISFVALPILIFWVIGAPWVAYIVLHRNRKNLEGSIKSYMLMLYQGYKPEVFYWELVNTIRKVLILCCSIFLSTETAIYKILLSIVVLVAILRIQIKLQPYKVEENNNLEQNMIIAGALTLFCGVLFTKTLKK